MIHFEGDMSFALPVSEVAEKLSDAGFLANSLPDVKVSESTPDKAAWKQRSGFSFLTGGLNLEALVTAREAGKSVVLKIVSKTIGASSTVETKLEFKDAEGGGTAVHWTGDVTSVTGLLKMVPKGLLEGAAKKVIEDVWSAVSAKLNSQASSK
ncbi:MAG: SRPBCC family protein [Planctomycetia bacterium]|nr:SRPBCC family protein [Planctomycetia bacterium]